jgi:transcriptional regulator with XRE-family HTH domain
VSKATLTPQKALGLRIKELRFEQTMTQEELAERSGMFRTYMSRVESGLANPTLTALHTLAKALNVDVRDLLTPPTTRVPKVRSIAPVSRGRVKS